MKKIIQNIMLLTALLVLTGCPGDDDDSVGCFSCLYEQQRTGCNNSNYSDWEERSITIDEPRDDLDPEQFCKESFPATDIECAAGCCVSFRYRNVRVGPCQ